MEFLSRPYVNPSVIIVDIIAYTIYLAISGAIVAWAMGMVKK